MKNLYTIIPLPAGTYFIGDPCYVMNIDDVSEGKSIVHTRGDDHFIAFGWNEGAGCVIGGPENSDSIGYDSGMFGVVPESLWTEMGQTDVVPRIRKGEKGLGIVATFTQPVLFKKVEDIVVVGQYAIDMNDSGMHTDMFADYDHDVDTPFDDKTGEETPWQLWGQYDKEGKLKKKGVEMDDGYWHTIGLNSEEAALHSKTKREKGADENERRNFVRNGKYFEYVEPRVREMLVKSDADQGSILKYIEEQMAYDKLWSYHDSSNELKGLRENKNPTPEDMEAIAYWQKKNRGELGDRGKYEALISEVKNHFNQ